MALKNYHCKLSKSLLILNWIQNDGIRVKIVLFTVPLHIHKLPDFLLFPFIHGGNMLIINWMKMLMLNFVCVFFVSIPIGIAVDRNGLIYFVDGTMIRKVDRNGIISTVLGSNDLTSARPLTCDTNMHIRQVIS